MTTAKVVTANGISRLEIKKGFGKTFILEGDEFQELASYLQDEKNLNKESTVIQNGDGAKTTLNNKEMRSLAEKLKVISRPLELPEGIEPVISKPTLVENPTPRLELIHKSKLQVISIMTAKIEWHAYAICPNCKTSHSLDIKIDTIVPDQFAAQCECGQILSLQK